MSEKLPDPNDQKATQKEEKFFGAETCLDADSPGKDDSVDDGLSLLARGETAGRYVILEVLGQGGMGVVYRAYDPELDRKIALKLLRVGAGGESDSQALAARDRLLREAQALAQLSHPNVVSAYDVGTIAGQVFVAMELVEGKTLSEWLRVAKPSRPQIIKVMVAAGRGIVAAHASGLIHRDFKPDNVIVGDDGRVRVLDFGLARPASSQTKPAESEALSGPEEPKELSSGSQRLHSSLTIAGAVVGTPGYMAPEQFQGGSFGEKSDQFSFCATLYFALTRQQAFTGRSYRELKERVLAGKVNPVPAQARLPKWLRQIVFRGLSVDPQARYPDIEQLLAALGRDPWARWRRLMAAAAVLAFAGGSAALVAWWNAEQGRLCRGAENLTARIWNAEVERNLQTAFADTGRSFAGSSFERVRQAVTGRLHSWTGMQTEACEATRIRGEQSEKLLDLRTICLHRRLQETEALLHLFAQADAQIVDKAVEAVHALTPVANCGDLAALEADIRPARDPATRIKVAAVRAQLADTQALMHTGKYPEGVVLATKAVAAARQSAYRPIEAEARYMLGKLQGNSGKFKAAEQSLEQAWWLAEAAGDDVTRLRAATALIVVVGYDQARRPAGHHWSRHCEAILDRQGRKPAQLAAWLTALGTVQYAEGKYAEAKESQEKALVAAQKALGAAHPSVGQSLNKLGIIYDSLGDYPRALAYYRQALAIAEKALGPDHPHVGESLNNIGTVLKHQGQIEKAVQYHQRARDLFIKALGPEHPDVAMCLNNLGYLFDSLGQDQQAKEVHAQALAIRQKVFGPDHPVVGSSLNNLGNILLKLGQTTAALDHHRRALAIWEKTLGPEHRAVGIVLGDMAQTQKSQGQLPAAIELQRRSLAIFQKSLGLTNPAVANAQFLLAQLLWQAHCQPRKRNDPPCPQQVRTLTHQARTTYNSLPGHTTQSDQIDQWLKTNLKRD